MGKLRGPAPRPADAWAAMLSEVKEPRVEVVCDGCNRRGLYRTAKLLAEFGDVPVPHVPEMIAERGKCIRAVFPASVYDPSYQDKRCKARFARPVT